MTQHDIAHTWTWTGSRTLPDWLTDRHHWHTGRPVIHTADGPRTLYHGWMVIRWTDQAITVASTTVAHRVYGPDGIAGRLERAEAAIARVHAKLDSIADFATRLDTSDTAPYHDAVDSIRATLNARPADDTTPGCTCGHTGRGVS